MVIVKRPCGQGGWKSDHKRRNLVGAVVGAMRGGCNEWLDAVNAFITPSTSSWAALFS